MFKDISDQIASTLKPLTSGNTPVYLRGYSGSSLAIALAHLSQERRLFCCMEDRDEAGYLYADLEAILGKDKVLIFPSSYRRAIKYGHIDEASQLMRSMVLNELICVHSDGGTLPIIVTYPEALAEQVVPPKRALGESLIVKHRALLPQKILMKQLYEWGYERVDYVYEPGQYAQRGSIIDVFAYSSELPYRLDYWDDEVDSLRSFDIESQLSVASLSQIVLTPSLGVERGEGTSLLEFLPPDMLLLQPDEFFLRERIDFIWRDVPQRFDGEGFESIEAYRACLVEGAYTEHLSKQMQHLYYRKAVPDDASVCVLDASPQPVYGKDYMGLATQIDGWQSSGYRVFISSGDTKQYERICDIIRERRGDLILPEHLPIILHEGFVASELKLVLLAEHQIFGRHHKYNLRGDGVRIGKMSLTIKDLATFHQGDLVVHSEHGVGRFGGLITIDLGGRPQECVKIEYNKGDTIFVNLHSLHKLSLYRSRDAAEGVTLSTIGTGAWQRLKEKTKKQIKDIARDLIKLYVARKESEGFAYSADSYLQHELEASFAYVDTPDQEQAIKAIKEDMERPYPMDRLLCGDVGFGKTEMAIRAAFKAVADGKQVAVLVPTTLLAYQHYRTFSQRFEGFPVRVEYLSRAKTAKALKQTLEELKSGAIDIIIGTHRLTSKDVAFKDLGLLVIDEEQKFGVATKEKLRKLQVNVDTLTMSATPIPRTLQFSLMGARDLSNLNTPPANRVAVETILSRFAHEEIYEAINFELSRNGQVYFVHNRIQNIEEIGRVILREVPDARLVIAHGQMPPSDLEKILIDFGNYEYDVLLSTTIIENGIDVPNANTIIINDAHRYGLSELHQLRGRVGRSTRKAFCYLLAPPIATLSHESRRRLRAIESFSDLGSGVRIALQDLDIRGAGNALGAEQSGFITDMGYEMYQKVFNEAVQELKTSEFAGVYEGEALGQRHVVAQETLVETDLALSLPEEYVPTDAERITLYRELDGLSSTEELSAYRSRLIDRFGNPPEEVEELIKVPYLRGLAQKLGIEKITLRTGVMNLFFPSDAESVYYQSDTFGRILSYVSQHTKRCAFRNMGERPIIRVKEVTTLSEALECLESMNN